MILAVLVDDVKPCENRKQNIKIMAGVGEIAVVKKVSGNRQIFSDSFFTCRKFYFLFFSVFNFELPY